MPLHRTAHKLGSLADDLGSLVRHPGIEGSFASSTNSANYAPLAQCDDSLVASSAPLQRLKQGRLEGVHDWHDHTSPSYVHPSMWCITLQDLDDFEREVRERWGNGEIPDNDDFPNEFHHDGDCGPSIHQVNQYYIKPVTAEAGGMSWALMRHPEGLECDIFATHCWSEGVFEFTSKVRSAWPRRGKNLWCCFLANPQNGDIRSLLEVEIQESPFAKALEQARTLLVIPNKRVSIYSRLWCVYEAHLALNACAEAHRNFEIRLPSEAHPLQQIKWLVPGFVILIASYTLGHFVIAQYVSHYLPPLLWLFLAILLGQCIDQITKVCVKACCQCTWTTRSKIVVAWAQLFVIGVGFGIARHVLRGLADDRRSWWRWMPGEGWSCACLALSMVTMYMYSICLQISRAVVKVEGSKLDFTTVRDAGCSDALDQRRIMKAIHGLEEEIDSAIEALRTVGRFNLQVLSNIKKGLSPEKAREGLGNFRVICACCAWSYWWVADLSGRKHHILALWSLVATCVAMLFVVHIIGERAIFAIDAMFWGGLAYVVASSALLHKLWPDATEKKNMSYQSLCLQILSFLCTIAACVWHYGGYHTSCRAGMRNNGMDCECKLDDEKTETEGEELLDEIFAPVRRLQHCSDSDSTEGHLSEDASSTGQLTPRRTSTM